MTPLRREAHSFDPNHFGTLSSLLADSRPDAQDVLMVACSDQGNAPDNVSFANANRFFIVQNPAASIPGSDTNKRGAILGSIAYSIELLNVQNAIVCGHLHCRVIQEWLKSDAQTSGWICEFFGERTLRFVRATYPDVNVSDMLDLVVREHVLLQLENLRSHEFVARRLSDGQLRLHGWLVDDTTARVYSFDPLSGQFVPIEETP